MVDVAPPAEHALMLDKMYRFQRFYYDATRKFYLLGRDRLLERMEVGPGDRVLEMGCGTARNLIALARRRPGVRLYGLDASDNMLATARAKVAQRKLSDRVDLRLCFAERLDFRGTFGLEGPFDAIFFSYALSMIPPWREAVDAALRNLRPGGALYIVDFWDQGDLPWLFRAMLQRWLAMFHVHHRPELLEYLRALDAAGTARLEVESVCRRYAWLARLENPR